jgi:hypothetical protein
MNGAHKIAVFGENVHMLYVAEMARNSGLLLLTYTLGNPQKFKVTICNLQSNEEK